MVAPMAPAETPEERVTLTEQISQGFDEGGLLGGIGATVKGVGSMFMPQTWQQPDLGVQGVFQDMVNFAPIIGDAQDLWDAAFNPDLDWLERTLAALPMLTVAGVGAGVAANSVRNRQPIPTVPRQAMVAGQDPFEYLNLDPSPDPTLEGLADPDARLREQQGYHLAAQIAKHPTRLGFLRTRSFESLSNAAALALDVEKPGGFGPSRLRVLGEVVRERLGSQGDFEAETLYAAQWAMTSWMRALDMGVVRIEGMDAHGLESRTVRLLFDPTMAPAEDGPLLSMMADVAVASMRTVGDPFLVPDPQSRVVSVYAGPDRKARVVQGIHTELLPTTRHVNSTTGHIDKPAKKDLNRRFEKLDFETVVGEMAVNVLNSYLEAGGPDSPNFDWYVRANKSAQFLADVSGRSINTVAAVISVMSPRGAWAPDNIVGAAHAVLLYSRPDLDPASPEYQQAIVGAIDAGGWRDDVFNGASKLLQKQYGRDGIVEYYANVENWRNKDGTIRGAEMGKQTGVELLLSHDIPWHVVLRAAKTHNFAHLIARPHDFLRTVIDVHQDRALRGTYHGPEPLGSSRMRSLRKSRKTGELEPETLRTGVELTHEDIEAAIERLHQAGIRGEELEKFRNRFKKVPEAESKRRYELQEIAHILVGEQLGVAANQVQSTSWGNWQARANRITGYLKAAKRKKNPADAQYLIDKAMSETVVDPGITNHLDGNPTMHPTAVMKVAQLDSELTDLLPDSAVAGIPIRGSKSAEAGQAILVEPLEDGRARVYAADADGVEDLLRHAWPTALTVGDRSVYLPRRPDPVDNVDAAVRDLTSVEGARGEARIYPTGSYMGMRPGNWLVAEYASREEAEAVVTSLQGLPRAVATHIQNVAVDRGAAVEPPADYLVKASSGETWGDLSSILGELKEPDSGFTIDPKTGEWASTGIAVAANGTDIVLPAAEAFGPDGQPTPMAVAALNSVLEEHAELFRSGRAWLGGWHNPADGNVEVNVTFVFDKRNRGEALVYAKEQDQISVADLDAITAGDWDNAIVEIGGTGGDARRTQLIVNLGGVETGFPWEVIDQAWELASNGATSRTIYTHGGLWTPANTVPVYESVYSDAAGRLAVWRDAADPGMDTPNRVKAHVPAAEMVRYGTESPVSGRRDLSQVADALEVDSDRNKIMVGRDVTIQYPEGAEVSRGNAHPGRPLSWKVDGQTSRSAVIDLATRTIRVGDERPVAKGIVPLDLARGLPKRISAWDGADAAEAHVILGKLAIDADLSEAEIVAHTQALPPDDTDFQPTRIVKYSPYKSRRQPHRMQRPEDLTPDSPRVAAENLVATERLRKHIPDVQVRWTEAVTTEQATEIIDHLEGLFDPNGIHAPFVARFGPLPLKKMDLTVATIVDYYMEQPRRATYGLTPFPDPSIEGYSRGLFYLNETTFHDDSPQRRAAMQRLAAFSAVERGRSPLAVTAVHEVGHLIEVELVHRGQKVAQEYDRRIRGIRNMYGASIWERVSPYAARTSEEVFAEVFTKAVYAPETLRPEEASLVEWALDSVRS